jgi:hypothetical protein
MDMLGFRSLSAFVYLREDHNKIVACLDNELNKCIPTYIQIGDHRRASEAGPVRLGIPKPSAAFIDKYIQSLNAGNPIKEVMIQYNLTWEGVPGYPKDFKDAKLEDAILRIYPGRNNTITLKPVKESWNREEVIEIVKEALEQFRTQYSRLDCIGEDKWLEEVL